MRTVVSFEPLGDRTLLKLEDAPTNIPGLGEPDFTELPTPAGTLVDRGKALRALLARHPSVGQGMATAFAQPAGAAPGPLYFHVVSARADVLPWEQLFDTQHGFCALDRRWPIGRIACRHQRVQPRSFVPPLRIVAVLSAAQQDGTKQLEALLNVATTTDGAAIGVHLHVISAQEEVLKAARAAGRPEVTVEGLPGTPPELERRITAARPHILHVLCHGGAFGGVRTLAFATLKDFDANEKTGSVRLKVPDLVSILRPCAPWLVVLSACATAESSDTLALAHDLVAEGEGIPAVAGMRRLVDITDTNRFCKALYPEVLSAVRAAVDTQPREPREIDWAAVFTAPRVVLSQPDPERADAWTDPVLYVQDDPLVVFPGSLRLSPADFATLRGYLDFWEEYVATFDPLTADPAMLAHARARIAATRAQLAEEGP
ncbi:CHAT domain-containing protein [Streptomyces lunaelactis]|uniref:CHAT domain-containing protein n=1 Tax=Streptomyces lunaelactis TaxID=1535768 RepID=UPI0015847DF9|nr:CHAT domain-containing protein [Streptomyces lunaelactis]NUK12345.1 CHAT domain-containing protein [Streptomyces lunaelactis]NUK35316.1 CHAT domain-containing protein [Streptomyces lunaelactis]NUK40955.1 CHAT domain-containing protein [Streptomyces lunaelactis]NUK59857.1 CHAT domain-containing protein [Streptomyces lunaelactis]NUK71019.1 CHAT domain-containing protein [Streptomyces lunaelactis]